MEFAGIYALISLIIVLISLLLVLEKGTLVATLVPVRIERDEKR